MLLQFFTIDYGVGTWLKLEFELWLVESQQMQFKHKTDKFTGRHVNLVCSSHQYHLETLKPISLINIPLQRFEVMINFSHFTFIFIRPREPVVLSELIINWSILINIFSKKLNYLLVFIDRLIS